MINIHLPLQLNIAQYKITQVQLVYGKFFGEVFSKEMQFFRFYVNIKYSQKITVLCLRKPFSQAGHITAEISQLIA